MKFEKVPGVEKLFASLNAQSLRDRILLFLLVISLSVFLVERFWVSPAQVAHKALQQRFARQSANLQRMSDQFKSTATPAVDIQKIQRDEIAAIKVSLDTVNRTISGAGAEAPMPLAKVLVHLLQQHKGLTLLRTSSAILQKAIGNDIQTAAELPAGLTQQGVELTLSGPYSELTRYVQTLENELPHVRWGSMKLISENSPTELTLQLFVVGEI
jgi:MSHA biogenesis protein MshJ